MSDGIDLEKAINEIISVAINVFEDEENASTAHVFGLLLVTATAWANDQLRTNPEHREGFLSIYKETADNIMSKAPWETTV